jgi:hypothetical protein
VSPNMSFGMHPARLRSRELDLRNLARSNQGGSDDQLWASSSIFERRGRFSFFGQ